MFALQLLLFYNGHIVYLLTVSLHYRAGHVQVSLIALISFDAVF